MSQQLEGSARLENEDFDYSVFIIPDPVVASRSRTKLEDVVKKIGGALHQWSVAQEPIGHAPFFRINKEENSFRALTPSREAMLTLQETMKNLFAGDEHIVVGTMTTENSEFGYTILISPNSPNAEKDFNEIRQKLSEHGLPFTLDESGKTLVAFTRDPEITIRMYEEAKHLLRAFPTIKIQRSIEPVRKRS